MPPRPLHTPARQFYGRGIIKMFVCTKLNFHNDKVSDILTERVLKGLKNFITVSLYLFFSVSRFTGFVSASDFSFFVSSASPFTLGSSFSLGSSFTFELDFGAIQYIKNFQDIIVTVILPQIVHDVIMALLQDSRVSGCNPTLLFKLINWF